MNKQLKQQNQALTNLVFKLIHVTNELTAKLYCLNENNNADMREIVKQRYELKNDQLNEMKQRFVQCNEYLLPTIKSLTKSLQPNEFEMLI